MNAANFSVGNKNNQTFVSVATTNSTGIIPNNEYYRYNFTLRNTASMLNDKLHLDLGASYVLQGDQNMLSAGRYFNPLVPLYLFPRVKISKQSKCTSAMTPTENSPYRNGLMAIRA